MLICEDETVGEDTEVEGVDEGAVEVVTEDLDDDMDGLPLT